MHFNLRETSALKALGTIEDYSLLNYEARHPSNLVYVTVAVFFMAAKFDEASLGVSFEDYHRTIVDLPSYAALLQHCDLDFDAILWFPGMFALLERRILQTLGWRCFTKATPLEILVPLLTVTSQLTRTEAQRSQKFFSSESFGSQDSLNEPEAQAQITAVTPLDLASVLKKSIIFVFMCITSKLISSPREPTSYHVGTLWS